LLGEAALILAERIRDVLQYIWRDKHHFITRKMIDISKKNIILSFSMSLYTKHLIIDFSYMFGKIAGVL